MSSSFAKVLASLEDHEMRSEIKRLILRNEFLKKSLLKNPNDQMFLKQLEDNTTMIQKLSTRLTQEDRELRSAVRKLVTSVQKTQRVRGASLRSASKSGGKRTKRTMRKTRKNRKA
jgi:hypothetical protein